MKRLAIVGSGISGMICAHKLKDNYKISIFEKNDYLGGHTHTHHMAEEGKNFTLDTGFIVFNLHTYPTLLRLFKQLKIQRRKSDMSFSVNKLSTGLEYSSHIPFGLFAQTKNLFSKKFWRMIQDIKAFNTYARRDFKHLDKEETIEDYCKRLGLSQQFLDNYLVPISSAAWSTPQHKIYGFPISLLLPFFFNHGLLSTTKHHQWYTVVGGSDTYTKRIVAEGDFDIHIEEAVLSAVETGKKVKLSTAKKDYLFDKVILASHSDESLKIAKKLPKKKKELLKKFTYNNNYAVLHTDTSVMPKQRRAWASWNHALSTKGKEGVKASTTYWMNSLQDIPVKTNYFLSLNPFQKIDKNKIIKELDYHHPLFTTENFELQKRLHELNANTKIYFAGAYFRYGFHEDGALAGMKAVKQILEDER